MAIKILGGEAKGLSLFFHENKFCRPTLTLLKRRIFDSNQDLGDRVFIDICAGTGAVGFEALSRGAVEILFIESSSSIFKLLQKNITKVSETFPNLTKKKITSKKLTFEKWLPLFKKNYMAWTQKKRQATILFFDPPYEKTGLYQILLNEVLIQKDWFHGELWIESDQKKGCPLSFWDISGFQHKKIFKQGDSYIIVIELQKN